MDGVAMTPDESLSRNVIYIKKGVYKENVEIKKKKWNIMMIGDGMDVTVISGNRSFVDGWTTFRSATFGVYVALRSDSDLSVFFRCAIKRVAGRKYPNQPTSSSFQFCDISADTDLSPSVNSTPTYLGRPCKLYSRTITLQSHIIDTIRPHGWLEWNHDFTLDALYYAEYKNSGPGASIGGRVQWPGYHVLNNAVQAINFTVAQFIEGNSWLPSTGVKYTSRLGI
ncbi:hypothetical protein V6N13_107364 [Hibiscus sabdariffa]